MENNSVRVGVGVLVYNKEGKFALIERKGSHGQGTWAPPGGHIDFGETAIETARREVKEEIGVNIDNLEVLGFTEDFFEKEQKHYITIFIKADWMAGELKASDKEWTEIGFFDMNNLPNPLFISFKNFAEGGLLPKRQNF